MTMLTPKAEYSLWKPAKPASATNVPGDFNVLYI